MEGRGVGGRIKGMEALDCREVRQAARASAAHALLFIFTIVLVLKLHHPLSFSCSWWLVFSPLWLFHIVVAQGRFSIPAPQELDAPLWDPLHAVVATPLLIAFELLLCIYLESSSVNHFAVMNLNIVFLPIYLLETIIIIDNLRMCFPLFLVDLELSGIDREFEPALKKKQSELNAIYCNYCFTTLAMPFILGATVSMVQMIIDNTAVFWVPIMFLSIALGYGFAFLVFLLRDHGDMFARLCNGFDIWAPIFGFQILLCMHLEGTLAEDRVIPIPYVFSPLFFFQGRVVLFSISQLVERIFNLLQHSEARNGRPLKLISRAHDFLEFLHHDSGVIGWWSVDEVSKEAQAHRIHRDYVSGCNPFCGSPPDLVKKMSKKDLVEEVFTLQDAIRKQIKVTESAQEEYEQFHREKRLCRICFEREISVLLLPCRHWILCSHCSLRSWDCPYCLTYIGHRLHA